MKFFTKGGHRLRKFLLSLFFVLTLTFIQIFAFDISSNNKKVKNRNFTVLPYENNLISSNEIEEIPFKNSVVLEKTNVRLFIPDESKIISIPIEDYVVGVLMGEMYQSAPKESLKAMAVAARTYTVYMIEQSRNKEYDVVADSNVSQAYVQLDDAVEVNTSEHSLYSIMKDATEKTTGQVLTYNGDVICALYHASSYMFTENCENVFVETLPYLSSVPSIENEKDVYVSRVEYTLSEFNNLLKNKNLPEFDETNIKIDCDINEKMRCEYLIIKDNEKGIAIDGKSARNIFSLRSTSFDVKLNRSKIIFSVKGFGHGVGLSQNGSMILANQGKSYEEILTYYYNGATVSKTIYK